MRVVTQAHGQQAFAVLRFVEDAFQRLQVAHKARGVNVDVVVIIYVYASHHTHPQFGVIVRLDTPLP